MAIRGIVKARNESHILADTLDNWARWCDAGIHVYCDACSDDGRTADIAAVHPAVVEVLCSDLMDPNRERAEWFNRSWLLHSARRFLGPSDWICYFDADEQCGLLDGDLLKNLEVDCVSVESYDSYITPEDAELSEWQYAKRQWVGPEWEHAPYFYRCRLPLEFYKPDQRNLDLPRGSVAVVGGKVRHWGKGLSIRKFDEKCRYYSEVFGPKYAAKWAARLGKAVHDDWRSDFGQPLVRWDDIISGKVPGIWRRRLTLVK